MQAFIACPGIQDADPELAETCHKQFTLYLKLQGRPTKIVEVMLM